MMNMISTCNSRRNGTARTAALLFLLKLASPADAIWNFNFPDNIFDHIHEHISEEITEQINDITGNDKSGARQDPHLTFAHGGKADFRGCDGCLFNFLSARDLSVNVKTQAATFMLRGSEVHGSFLTEVHVAYWDRPKNVWMNTSYWAQEVGDQNWGWRMVNGTCDGRKYALGPHGHDQCYGSSVSTGLASAEFKLPEWELRIESRRVFGHIKGPEHRLDLAMKPTVRETDLSAWPHGIIGQSYDGDDSPISGKQDDYSTPIVHTEAMAEGAIEGTWADYQVNSPFETRFKYSRFDATMATSRPRAMAKATVVSEKMAGYATSSEVA